MRGNFITDRIGKNNPNYKDGRKNSRIYRIYYDMKSRCYNSNVPHYKNYGGRGIVICDEWLKDFEEFHNWAMSHGYRDNLTIDRIDVNGNYEPNNCRWVSIKEQANNTRANHLVTIDGITKNLTQWSEFYNINVKTVRDRLKRGWNVMEALTVPADIRFKKKVIQ